MSFLSTVGGALGTAYDYLTPGKGSNRLTDWAGWGDKVAGGGGGGGGIGGGAKPSSAPSTASSDFSKELAASQAEIRNLMARVNAQPRLANFDVMANWRNAQSAAERAQNPLYEQKLNDFLSRNAQKKVSKTNEFGLTKENINLEKAQALEDSAVARVRTTEDTQAAIDKLNKQEGYYQADEGQQFDVNYRQAAEQVAASGGANTGLGKQQTYDAIKLRNITSQRQLDEFNGQRQAKQLFKDRTFEDLARGDERANILATNKTKGAEFDYEDYLNELAYDETNFRFANEADRLAAVLRDTGNYEKAGSEAFLAGLAGQGYSAADVAYNRQVYGR